MIETIDKIAKPNFQKAWSIVEKGLFINNKTDYKQAVKILDNLLDIIGDNDKHPLYSYLDTLGTLIAEYEKNHLVPMDECSPVEILQLLMKEHNLTQRDLFEIGSQGVISEILNHKRQLTLRQIKKLSEKFSVSPEVFI